MRRCAMELIDKAKIDEMIMEMLADVNQAMLKTKKAELANVPAAIIAGAQNRILEIHLKIIRDKIQAMPEVGE